FVTFRISHDDKKEPLVLQIANVELVKKMVRCELVDAEHPVKWSEKGIGSFSVKLFNRSDKPVMVVVKPKHLEGVSFNALGPLFGVPANGEMTGEVPFSVGTRFPELSALSLSATILTTGKDEQYEVGTVHVEDFIPMKPLESPCLLITKAMIPEIQRRIRETETGKEWWEGILKKANDWLDITPQFPPRGGQWWHWYTCEKCGVSLKTEGPTKHVCPVCKKVYSGWPYDDVVLDRDHHNLAYATRDLGLVYQLTKDARYAAKAREILMGYAERYLNYPLHDIHGKPTGGGGHVTPQTLDESTWSIPLIQGFDCVKEQLSAKDIAFISEKMLLPCAYHIKKHQWGIHNICCWHNSAYGLVGLTLAKSDLVYGAIFGPKGFLAQVEKGVTDDGPWYERAWGYHFYTMSAMRPLEEAIMNTKIIELPKRYKLMYDAPLKFLTPTYQLPAFHDSSRVGFSFAGYSSWYEGAYTAWRDPVHGEIVKAGKRNSLEAILFGIADIQTSGSTFKSEDYHDTGVAVLRTQSPKLPVSLIPSNFIALDYGEHGGGHGHPDKLNFVLYAHNQLIAEDPGCIAYGNPAHPGWYRQTVSHNTLVVDGKSQAPATGHCLAFAAIPQAALCVAEAGNIYKGVKAYRAIAMIEDNVFDLLWADSDAEHQYEYAFHARGMLTATQEGEATNAPQGDGYSWAKDWKLLKTAAVQNFVWSQEKVKLALTLKQMPDGETRTAVGMGNPATVKPPFVLSRINGKSALFGGVFQIGTPDAELKPADVALKRNGSTIEMKATFADGKSYVFAVKIDELNGKAKLVREQNGRLETVLLAD
ncbi:MAG: heparinase II/III family protein, partial [Victivallales bacterium]|nr:heparinase II/III family protein [Victivallales bacterium]